MAASTLRLLALLFLLSLPMFCQTSPVSQENGGNQSSSIELQVKAAFLYKFGNFVEWPEGTFESPDSPFVIGILGADNFADVLAQMVERQTVKGRRVLVRKLSLDDSAEGLNVLFIGQSLRGQLDEILQVVRRPSLLIVTESKNALAFGSMINFVTVDGKVRFDIAPDTARESELTIGSRLLSVAHEVVSKDPEDR